MAFHSLLMADATVNASKYLEQPLESPPQGVRPLPKSLKRNVILALGLCYLLYRVLYRPQVQSGQCIIDLTHEWSKQLNDRMNHDAQFRFWMMLIAQLLIDINLLLMIVVVIVRARNFWLPSALGLFYGLRTLLLKVDKFPYPAGIVWKAPEYPPSLAVPYGITRDFFPSGHTGFMTISILFWSLHHKTYLLMLVDCVGLLHVILVLITTRVHYNIDIVGGAMYAYFMFWMVGKFIVQVDMAWTAIYRLLAIAFNIIKRGVGAITKSGVGG